MAKEKSFLDGPVWDRRFDEQSGSLTRAQYIWSLTGWTVAGLVFSGWISTISSSWHLSKWGMLGFALAVLIVSLIGVGITARATTVAVCTLGYAFVAGSFGLLLGPLLAQYETGSVVKVFAITLLIVLGLGSLGAVLKKDLASWGSWLLGGLLLLIGAYVLLPLLTLVGVPVGGALTWVDWIGVLLFGAIVVYDLNRAVRLPHTQLNAVGVAVSIYLDILNMFVRLLALFGVRSS